MGMSSVLFSRSGVRDNEFHQGAQGLPDAAWIFYAPPSQVNLPEIPLEVAQDLFQGLFLAIDQGLGGLSFERNFSRILLLEDDFGETPDVVDQEEPNVHDSPRLRALIVRSRKQPDGTGLIELLRMLCTNVPYGFTNS